MPHPPDLRSQSLRILYVEDNAELRDTFHEMLEAEGREVVACANGEEALALWNTSVFDVVLTDISLPGMSGTDLARRVLGKDPRNWVVLCSGYQYHQGLNALGPNVRSLPKPFELEELDALMNEITRSLRRP